MVFIQRVVEVEGEEALRGLEAAVNSCLVSENTIRMNEVLAAAQRFDAALEMVPGEAAADYLFDVVSRHARPIGKVRRGSWLKALWKKDPKLIPESNPIYKVELVIDTDPSLINSIDRALVQPPYSLRGGYTISEARLSFSTKLSEGKAFASPEADSNKKQREDLEAPYIALADAINAMIDDDEQIKGGSSMNHVIPSGSNDTFGSSVLRGRASVNRSPYGSSTIFFKASVSGSVVGDPRAVLAFQKAVEAEIKGRGLRLGSSSVEYLKGKNGNYLPPGSETPLLPRGSG